MAKKKNNVWQIIAAVLQALASLCGSLKIGSSETGNDSTDLDKESNAA